jgi:glycine/D-amino acid oxidase-like deaminating enzyme
MLEERYRARSLWLDGLPGPLVPHAPLAGDLDCDVAIVGAGFTGLWTAYALATAGAGQRIVVLEAEIAGYGASGRNAGFVSAGIAGDPAAYGAGAEAIVRAEREMIHAIDEIGRVIGAESVDCGYVKSGSFRVATSRPQLERIEASVRRARERGLAEEDVRLVTADEIGSHVRIEGAVGGSYTPHCGRVDPARLVRGLADACERHRVTIHESSPARRIEPRCVVCDGGVVRADVVVLATESYTTRLPGEDRSYLPLFSHMIATEPLPPAVWDQVGWREEQPIADQHYLFVYAQRTPDGRIALGGAGSSYKFGGAIREQDEQRQAVRVRLEKALRRYFPAAAGARVSHHWGGPLGAPRDWSMSISFDRTSGLLHLGGYTGHGVVASRLAGRTAADLILGRDSDLLTLPWVGHRSPRWPPEPVRFLGARATLALLASADRYEDRTGRAARRVRLVSPVLPPR